MAKRKAPARNAKSDTITKRVTKKDPLKLTKQQEEFARAYVKTGNASEAYRQAYAAGNMTEGAINVEACRMLDHPKIAHRIKSLMAPGLKKAAMDAEATMLELATVAGLTPTKVITYGEKISALALLAKHHGMFEKDNKQRAESMSLEVLLVAAKK